MPAPHSLTRRLNDALKSAGLDLAFVAKAIGRSEGTIRNALNGSVPSPQISQALANFFGFTVHGMKPEPHLSAIMLPEGAKIVGFAPEPAANIAKFFGDCLVNAEGEITLQRARRILFARPRSQRGQKSKPKTP